MWAVRQVQVLNKDEVKLWGGISSGMANFGTSSHGMENKLKSPLDWKTLENLTWIAKWRVDSPAARPTADTIGHAWTRVKKVTKIPILPEHQGG